MTPTHCLVFWLALYGQVALLGFQSRNVNTGQYVYAACTSCCISIMNILVIRTIALSDPYITLAISCTAGPAGIVSSMLLHRKFFGVKKP